jgi:hypothetical protein
MAAMANAVEATTVTTARAPEASRGSCARPIASSTTAPPTIARTASTARPAGGPSTRLTQ